MKNTNMDSAYEPLKELFLKSKVQMYSIALHRLRVVEDAQDAICITQLKAIRKWPSYDPAVGSLHVWFWAIFDNAIIDVYRDRKTRRQTTFPLAEEHDAQMEYACAVTEMASGEFIDCLERELSRADIPGAYRKVIELIAKGETIQQAVLEAGLPKGSVRTIRKKYGELVKTIIKRFRQYGLNANIAKRLEQIRATRSKLRKCNAD